MRRISRNMEKIINGVQLKEAESNFEKAILGLIEDEAKKLGYGRLNIEVVIHNNRVTHIDCYSTKRSLSVNGM